MAPTGKAAVFFGAGKPYQIFSEKDGDTLFGAGAGGSPDPHHARQHLRLGPPLLAR